MDPFFGMVSVSLRFGASCLTRGLGTVRKKEGISKVRMMTVVPASSGRKANKAAEMTTGSSFRRRCVPNSCDVDVVSLQERSRTLSILPAFGEG